MGHARICEQLSLHPRFLTQQPLIHQGLIAQRIQPAHLKRRGRMGAPQLVGRDVGDDIVERRAHVRHLGTHEAVDQGLGENRRVLILLHGHEVGHEAIGHEAIIGDDGDQQRDPGKWSGEPVSSGLDAQDRRDVAARARAADDEAGGQIGSQGGSAVVGSPHQRVPAVQHGGGKRMVRRKPVTDVDHDAAQLEGEVAAVELLAVHVADAEAAAVDEEHQRRAALARLGGHVGADR
jgi:hypothetical protein